MHPRLRRPWRALSLSSLLLLGLLACGSGGSSSGGSSEAGADVDQGPSLPPPIFAANIENACGRDQTCSGDTPECCANFDARTCIAHGAPCGPRASRFACDGPEDCGGGQTCCGGTNHANYSDRTCVPTDQCLGQGYVGPYRICHDDKDCVGTRPRCCFSSAELVLQGVCLDKCGGGQGDVDGG